jgi:hypothetical protein
MQWVRAHWGLFVLAAAAMLHALMLGSLFWGYLDALFADSALHPRGTDFFAVFEGGRNAIEGRSLFFYDAADTSETPYHTPYRYIPFLAYAIGAPFNALDAWDAYWAWVAFNELLLVLTAFATWRVGGRGNWAIVAAAMWFAFSPYYLELYMGQFSFLMAVLLFWVGVGVMRGREAVAGAPWIASLIAKSNSAMLFPLFLRLGWWRTLAAAAAVVSLSMLYFAFRPGDFDYFLWLNLDRIVSGSLPFLELEAHERETYFFVDPELRYFRFSPGELGAVGLITNALLIQDADAATVPSVYTTALVLAVLAGSLAATFLPRENDRLTLFALWSAVFFLAYTVWEHHYVMLLPALALLVALRPAHRPWALLAFVLTALPAPYWLMNNVFNTAPLPAATDLVSRQEVWPAWGVVVHHAVKPLPVMVLWGYLVVSELLPERARGPRDAEIVTPAPERA